MFSTLFAVVVALVLGHVAPSLASSLRHYGWYAGWLRWLEGQFAGQENVWRGHFGIVLALLPPLLLVALFQIALGGRMFGFPALLFGVAMLFYAWGPRDLDLDVREAADAQDPAARQAAAGRLWPAGATAATDAPGLVAAIFRSARGRWFGVLFWFLLLGPFGALLYRLTALAAEGEVSTTLPAGTLAGARALLAVLDWPITQLMAASLALVGNFDVVVGAWREAGSGSFALHGGLLETVARASVCGETGKDAAGGLPAAAMPDLPELSDAMSLVWRVLLLWLAVIALFVIGGWVS